MFKEIILAPFTFIYWLIVSLRNYLYKNNTLRATKFDLPVICVGNLSAGGTGKTPHTNYLINLIKPDYNVAVLSRGYKRKTKGYQEVNLGSLAENVGDEPLFYKYKHPDAKIAVCEDRVFGISAMAQNEENNYIYLLDDAFQHRAIKAGLNILLTDYSRLYTHDKLLPVGRLREDKKGADRADIIIVTKCPYPLSEQEKNEIKAELNPKSYQYVFFSSIQYQKPYALFQEEKNILEKETTLLLVTGIAKPKPLETELKKRFKKVYSRHFADHHNYQRQDIESILRTFKDLEGDEKIIMTTEKDATRLLPFKNIFETEGIRVFCMPIQVIFEPKEKESFDKAIKHYLSITLPIEVEPEDTIINYDYKD